MGLALALGSASVVWAAPAVCRTGVIEGEVKAGESFTRPLGNGLELKLEPLASGWILRVVPTAGQRGDHDYAELATPPYHSVSPLLISTDFAFRAQDAVGWNPRRFRFAPNAATYAALRAAYQPYESAASKPTPAEEQRLSAALSSATSAVFQIVDARLIGGTADQWQMAGAVASHFTTTAHTVVDAPEGKTTPLGKLLWLRFRVRIDLPPASVLKPDRTLKLESAPCPF
ncbi:hypothetical protein SAMN05421770_103348 [Granulicella rosea]|uniref:Uncharacterized protein n=1 Tax=Granulicella rosea TaxID=474952 RepID=A0A239IYB3_9BACT|nr:hypothetical protein [Granulicella rosea]SNS98617.1 hypothetical protein SAMN05421770_103348 [Granulicella rosea]